VFIIQANLRDFGLTLRQVTGKNKQQKKQTLNSLWCKEARFRLGVSQHHQQHWRQSNNHISELRKESGTGSEGIYSVWYVEEGGDEAQCFRTNFNSEDHENGGKALILAQANLARDGNADNMRAVTVPMTSAALAATEALKTTPGGESGGTVSLGQFGTSSRGFVSVLKYPAQSLCFKRPYRLKRKGM
jgi:hypothetical protein